MWTDTVTSRSAEDQCLDPWEALLCVVSAAYLGIFVTCCTVVPSVLKLRRGEFATGGDGLWESVAAYIGIGLSTFPYAALATFPIVIFVIAVTLIFRKSIQKHTVPWCIAAPIAEWLLALTILDLVGLFDLSRLFGASFLNAASSELSLIFLTGPIPSSVIFYWIWHKMEKGPVLNSG